MSDTVPFMWVRTSFSRHFMGAEVSATGLKSFSVDELGFFGTGMIMVDLNTRDYCLG